MSSYVFPDNLRDSIASKLIDLFTLPSRIFEIPVNEGRAIAIKLRLLTDKENQEIANIGDRYGPLTRVLVQRREVLARAVETIEGGFIEMPEEIKQAYRDRWNRDPTPVEQKLWIFEQCQPVILQELTSCYEKLLEEQSNEVSEIKKKFGEHLAGVSPEMR